MGGTAAGSEHFARNLRELKDRSGLSYGQLASRLHVSTSTLHRYCNGDAVPADYAVVERLARLCGAGPEELVELHRRWVLADAVRRVGNRGGGGAGAERGELGDGGGDGELGGEGEGGADDGGDDAAPVGKVPAGPAPLPVPEAAAEAAAPVTPVELEPIGTVPPPRRPRSWRRRLSRPAVAGSVAALVLTGAALAMTDGTGGEGAPARASSSSPSPRPGGADGTPPRPAVRAPPRCHPARPPPDGPRPPGRR